MQNKNNNRSLLLYTALIFLAAIVVVAISFFAQVNADKNHQKYGGEEIGNSSIAEKINALSNENQTLLKTIDLLQKNVDDVTQTNSELTDKVLRMDKELANAKAMYVVYDLIQQKKIEEAVLQMETVDQLFLTEEQKVFYNYLNEMIQ